MASMRRRWRIVLPILATVALLAPLAYLWQASLVPKHYSVMQMGYVDSGGGPQAGSAGHSGHGGAGSVSVETLVADPARKADQTFDLVAAEATLTDRRSFGAGLHPERHLARADADGQAGRAGRGAAAERVGDRRDDPALARPRRTQRDGRRGRGDPGRGARRAASSSTGSSPSRWGRTGTTRTRSRTSR